MPPPMPSKKVTTLANVLGGLAWWWILWHIATEPEHVYVSILTNSKLITTTLRVHEDNYFPFFRENGPTLTLAHGQMRNWGSHQILTAHLKSENACFLMLLKQYTIVNL